MDNNQKRREVKKNPPKKKKRKKKKKFNWKLFLGFIIFEIVFSLLTGPFMLFYGPFKNVKTTVVGSAMTTMTHQYIAKLFLSDEKIAEILSSQVVDGEEQTENSSSVQIPTVRDESVEAYDASTSKFKAYMLVVKDPTRIKVGYTSKLGKEGEMTSKIAGDNGAVAAINGGGFPDQSLNYTGTGAVPNGVIITGGEVKYKEPGAENTELDTMAFTKEGRLLVGKYTLNELKEKNVKEALSFGPALVVDGKGTIRSGDGGWGVAPRTAIGQRHDGAVLMLVIDGRRISSIGATLREVQDIMLKYGAVNAINLDGGSSSTMYYEGEVINNPPNSLGERAVPSIVYVK